MLICAVVVFIIHLTVKVATIQFTEPLVFLLAVLFGYSYPTVNYDNIHCFYNSRGGGGGLQYITDGDARRNFQKKPLKVTILGVAPANFIP